MVFVNASHLRRVGLCVGQNQMCHLRTGLLLFFGVRELRLCGGNKIELKKYAVGKCFLHSRTPLKNENSVSKIKNTEGSAMSVGLLVVRLLYRFYVFGHLSKWFTFSVFLSVIFCRVVVFYACTQRFRALRSGGFRSTKLSTCTTLDTKHKAPSLHVTPPDAKPMLALRHSFLSCCCLSILFCRGALAWWLFCKTWL